MSQRYDKFIDQANLKASIESLTPMGVRFVGRIIDSLSSPLQAEASDTWLGQKLGWIEYFGLTISVHHGTTTETLGLIGFEVAFRNACDAVGWTVDEPRSATQRFVDMTVHTDDGEERKLSLKSTAAQRLSETTAHISKLTEAAWIQDVRNARTRRDHTLELFRQYRSAVDAIIMLRAFRPDRTAVPTKYQLLEIPTDIFASLEDAPLEAFAADRPTIHCPYDGDPAAARISLDRSDAKITVKQIKLSACTIHAEWSLDTSSGLSDAPLDYLTATRIGEAPYPVADPHIIPALTWTRRAT